MLKAVISAVSLRQLGGSNASSRLQDGSFSSLFSSSAASSSTMEKVGFMGIGNMGAPMASNLIKAGFNVVVCDRNPRAVEQLRQQGAEVVAHAKHLSALPGMAAVITMLPTTEHVKEAYEGPDGLLAAHGEGVVPCLFIDSSTILPTYTAQLAETIARCKLRASAAASGTTHQLTDQAPMFVDAPVSGGVPGAVNATLTFMCGGTPEAMAAARPILSAMGQKIVHMGHAGAGQAAKICNNLACGIEMAAISEALALGIAVGLDPRQLSAVFNTSSARCWSSDSYNPCPGVMSGVPSSQDYKGGFNAALMLKDLRLAVQLAAAAQQPVPMTEQASKLYEQVVASVQEPIDFGAIFKVVYKAGQRNNLKPGS